MAKTVLKLENISKLYRLGEVGTGTISHDLNRWWHRVRGKEDPYQQIGTVNQRDQRGDSDYVWALKDINLEVKEGEILGIIGANGAGKSTLLKILSKVTAPTTGRIRGKGKISALLEVGTGFHPELTARENIYLNGAILGMRRHEITAQLDEIVDFAGIERYLDTPVKRFSSGMNVRLGFAVAAHLQTDILIVDEVLAVGDTEFQKKCIGKMGEISEGQGKTVLFVSHNMESIQQLSLKSILIKQGEILKSGNTNEIVNLFLSGEENIYNIKDVYHLHSKNSKIYTEGIISKIIIYNSLSEPAKFLQLGEKWAIKIKTIIKEKVSNTFFVIEIDDLLGSRIATAKSFDDGEFFNFHKTIEEIELNMNNLNLWEGIYILKIRWMKRPTVLIDKVSLNIKVVNSRSSPTIKGYFKLPVNWKNKKKY